MTADAGFLILEENVSGGVGGPVTDGLSWRWVFFINVPIGLAMLAVSPLLLRESRTRGASESFDVAGAVSITAALALLVYAVTEAPRVGWATPLTVGMLTLSAALVGVFAFIETRSPKPLLPLAILRSSVRSAAT